MAHTPAPWKTRWHHGQRTAVIEAGGERIARDIQNRDADLIAAAPDLYAVCKLLFQSMGEVIEDQNEVAYSDLRMALVKAEGET